MVTGRSLEATTEKGCPVKLSFVISTGAEPPFARETAVLAVWPINTAPKETELGDALRAPESASFTRTPPQPDKTTSTLQHKMMSRVLHQTLRGRT